MGQHVGGGAGTGVWVLEGLFLVQPLQFAGFLVLTQQIGGGVVGLSLMGSSM